ncbi:MAG: hypothetical protein OXE50_09470, partial [Chloroflexi bacterium]|nr:hypothetical protein [Chloroflexota bacterium]
MHFLALPTTGSECCIITDQHVTDDPESPRAERDAVLFDRLERFVDRQGVVGAAETLGVNYRTLGRCLENGRPARKGQGGRQEAAGGGLSVTRSAGRGLARPP